MCEPLAVEGERPDDLAERRLNMPTFNEYGTRNKYEDEVARALAALAARA